MGLIGFTSYKKLYQSSLVKMDKLINDFNSGVLSLKRPSFDRRAYTNMLVNKDRILCANRYVWKNLPINLTSQQLESMFYEFGSLCFFVQGDKLIISRYALEGDLNPYGKLTKIRPIDLKGKSYGPVLNVVTRDGANLKEGEPSAVIINDYTFTYMQEPESRAQINLQSTIMDQVDTYQQLKTNITLSVKKALALCENEDQKRVVLQQAEALINPDTPVVPIATSKGNNKSTYLPVEMFNFNNNFETQNYCQQIDYYDKVRRSFNGIPSPDTFEKKERKVVGETEDTTTHTNLVLMDGLNNRLYGLELMKKYLKLDSIKSVTVDLNDELKCKIKEEEDDEYERARDDVKTKNNLSDSE